MASDDFERTVASGWGTADSGGAWTVQRGGNRFAVSSGAGRITASAGTTAEIGLTGVTSTHAEVRARLAFSTLGTGGSLYASVEARRVSSSADYRAKLIMEANNRIQLQLVRNNGGETVLANVFLPSSLTHRVANTYEIAVQATGTNPTTLRTKVWLTGTSEPNWQLTTTDGTAALQSAGSPGVLFYVSRSFTGGTSVLAVDGWRVTAPQ